MAEPIKVGDLVQVVRPSDCGCPTVIGGYIFAVTEIRAAVGTCTGCQKEIAECQTAWGLGDGTAVSVWRLKRIPDFPELADERHDEEITA